MSLRQRVERAQLGPNVPNAGALVPVPPPVAPNPTRIAAREELLGTVRLRLQNEVIGAFDSNLDVSNSAEVRTKVEGDVDRIIGLYEFAVTRDERQRLIDEMVDEVTGFGPLEPLLRDDTITEVMVNGPNHIYIERGGKIQRVDVAFPERRARPADHRPDHHPAGTAHRRVEPKG